MILDERYNLAVCIPCAIALPFDWILAHLKDHHGVKSSLNDVMEQLNIEESTMTFIMAQQWIRDTWVLAKAVNNVPVMLGRTCNLCIHSIVKNKSMQNHFSEKHKGLPWSENSKECKVQSPFKGQLAKYIQIDDSEDINMHIDEDNEWKSALELEFQQSIKGNNIDNGNEHEDIRLMGTFIAKIRWDLAIKDMDKAGLIQLASLPTIKDPVHAIILCGRRYIQQCCSHLNGGNMMIKRLLMSSRYILIYK